MPNSSKFIISLQNQSASSHASSLPSAPMASSLPSSPMASDLPSSPSSHASSPSSSTSSDASSTSTTSLPSSYITVASVDEVRLALRSATPEVQLKFQLAPDSSLAEAHKLWELVTAQGGGEAVLINPDRLSYKEEALHCVKSRLERLRRWERHLGRKHDKVLVQVSKLDEVVDAGGPGVRPGYQPHNYDGLSAYIDIEQDVDKEEMREHIEAIRALLLQGSPGSPATDGGDGSVDGCEDREAKEQLDIARFNHDYLELKATGLELLRGHLVGGIAALEKRFVDEPTHLGAGDAEFVNFIEVPMYAGEAPPPQASHDFYC